MAKKTSKHAIDISCPFCGKMGREVSRDRFGDDILVGLACGHTLVKQAMEESEVQVVSSDGKTPFPFQYTPTGTFIDDFGEECPSSVNFIEEADCNALCLHEMGLGKTVIECILLARNPQLLPALIIVKSGLRAQWFMEVFRWTGMAAQIITSSREVPHFDIFQVVIVSIDTLRLLRPDVKVVSEYEMACAQAAGKRVPQQAPPVWTDEICAKFKHIAVDESQKIKNPGASRTQAFQKILKAAKFGNDARIVCYSGTNIEKHSGEFFVTLNAVRPELFPQQSSFQIQHCEVNPETGKLGGLKNPQRFKDLTEDFIIRYKRERVMSHLPKIFRKFRLAEMEGDELAAYIKVVKEFKKAMEDEERPILPTDILGYLSKMRHITGIAKTKAAAEFIEEFLMDDDPVEYDVLVMDDSTKKFTTERRHGGRKLVVFLHHKMAGAILEKKLTEVMEEGAFTKPLYLNAELDMQGRTRVLAEFQKPENRILIASTLAAGEGLNMQFCSDCLMMERQWNPSYEEQAEARFPRPGSLASQINATYLIAAGTIDDFLTELVEYKRRNVAQTLDGKEIEWDEKSLVMELAKTLQAKGLRKWGIK
jgi:SNF2 family DNA or RNA helicase